MDVDLAAAANRNATRSGSARAVWSGGKVKVDEVKFLELVARAVAFAMGMNLFNGRRPDGSGMMPARKRDGQPRGTGARIARALAAVRVGRLSWHIAAHREIAGHLARIMVDIPFLSPPIDGIRAAVHAAFRAALELGGHRADTAAARQPTVLGRIFGQHANTRAGRREAAQVTRRLRTDFNASLHGLGMSGEKAYRTRLGSRIASAARGAVRRGRAR